MMSWIGRFGSAIDFSCAWMAARLGRARVALVLAVGEDDDAVGVAGLPVRLHVLVGVEHRAIQAGPAGEDGLRGVERVQHLRAVGRQRSDRHDRLVVARRVELVSELPQAELGLRGQQARGDVRGVLHGLQLRGAAGTGRVGHRAGKVEHAENVSVLGARLGEGVEHGDGSDAGGGDQRAGLGAGVRRPPQPRRRWP